MSLHRITPTTRLLARTFNNAPSGSMSIARMVVPPSMKMATRSAATTAQPNTVKLSPAENLKMLNEQRSVRPSSPHFTIYQPQLTWYGSIFNRITGVGLSVGLYAYAAAYLAAPLAGYPELLTSGTVVSAVASLPFWAKVTLKAPLALAFSYHTFNGIRHLLWDRLMFLSVKGCYQSGYAVIGATVLSTIGLCLI
ncbi:unnamed protein product [Sympodiomycopsis kandeliae]